MLNYITKRILLLIPTLLGITLITFFLMKLAPGDPTSLKMRFMDSNISPQALAAELAKSEDPLELPQWYKDFISSVSTENSFLEKSLKWTGKNSIYYAKWLSKIMVLDFGISSKDKRPVTARIKEALPVTLALNIITIFIVYFVSIPLGIWSAVRQSSVLDKVIMVKLFLLYALPEFWVATVLLVYFAGGEYLNIFPLMGIVSDGWSGFHFVHKLTDMGWHLFLPILASVLGSFAFLTRFSRTNFLEVIRQDYIRTARAKGLSESRVIWKHAFRNSLIPLVTLMGTLLPGLMGGSVVIEQIFSIPGMGMLSFEAVLARDYNVIMGLASISAFLTLLSLLISDLLYVVVDPRITFESR